MLNPERVRYLGGMDDQSLPGDALQTSGPAGRDGFHCLSCGYDLAGISPDGDCPECRYPIRDSRELGLLSQPVPTLTRIRSGAIWIFIGIGAQFVGGTANSVFSAVGAAMGQQSMAVAIVLGVIGALFALAGQSVSVVGYWRYTTPLAGAAPPRMAGEGYRRTMRVTSVLMLVLTFLTAPTSMMVVLGGMAQSGGAQSRFADQIMLTILVITMGLSVLTGLTELIRYLCTAAYTAALARRLPNLKLALRATRVYRWTAGIIIAAIGLVALFAISAALSGVNGSAFGIGAVVSGIGALVIGVIAFALWIAWIVMLAQFLAAISKVRKRAMAEQTP